MKKGIIIIGLLILISANLCGQQHALYSQYLFNLYVVNPAYCGEEDGLSLNGSYRAQWAGFDGAPITQNFNAHSPLNYKNMALGIQFQNEALGARNTTAISAAYSYKLRLSGQRHISLGLQGGLTNFQFDWNELTYPDGSDPIAIGSETNKWVPVFDFGVLYQTPSAYVGLSITGLNNVQITDLSLSDYRLDTFFNLVAGRVFDVSEKVALKPSAILRKSIESPYQFDLNMGIRYLNRYWLTATYRYGFGLVFSGQIYLSERFHFGYAYDLPTNELLSAQSGTHEIYLGYILDVFSKRRSEKNPF